MTAPRFLPPTDSPALFEPTGTPTGTNIPSSPRRREADYTTVAWALTAVTCFVLAIGIFVIRQVIETPTRGSSVVEIPLAEEAGKQQELESPLLVLRPEKPSTADQKSPSLPMMR